MLRRRIQSGCTHSRYLRPRNIDREEDVNLYVRAVLNIQPVEITATLGPSLLFERQTGKNITNRTVHSVPQSLHQMQYQSPQAGELENPLLMFLPSLLWLSVCVREGQI